MADYTHFDVELKRLLEACTDLAKAQTKLVELQIQQLQQQDHAMEQAIESLVGHNPKAQGKSPLQIKHPYGFCPHCGAEGISRDRDGIDICANSHRYPSSAAKINRCWYGQPAWK